MGPILATQPSLQHSYNQPTKSPVLSRNTGASFPLIPSAVQVISLRTLHSLASESSAAAQAIYIQCGAKGIWPSKQRTSKDSSSPGCTKGKQSQGDQSKSTQKP